MRKEAGSILAVYTGSSTETVTFAGPFFSSKEAKPIMSNSLSWCPCWSSAHILALYTGTFTPFIDTLNFVFNASPSGAGQTVTPFFEYLHEATDIHTNTNNNYFFMIFQFISFAHHEYLWYSRQLTEVCTTYEMVISFCKHP
jgi:hypothetical protein